MMYITSFSLYGIGYSNSSQLLAMKKSGIAK